MGMLHSLLGVFGLASAGQARTLTKRVEAADQRAVELKRAVADAREETSRWKSKAGELTERVGKAEQAAERLPKVERELQQWKARDEKHVAQLAEVRDRMVRAEHSATLSQEHLTATETKLDVIEAALNVLDRRTRKPL
jgi:predicted  nucleic acid-binding Zn-ribbon protein